MRSRLRHAALLSILTVSAAPLAAQAPTRSTAADREAVSVTIYNQNFGLVREVRNVETPRGIVGLEFRDVASGLETSTVRVHSRDDRFRILEQNYRYDLLTPQKLLESHVGRTVTFHQWVNGEEVRRTAELLSVQGGTVIRIGDEILANPNGRFSYSEVPEDLIPDPTLVWLVDSDADRHQLEVSYLSGGLGWQADYVMLVDDADERAGLTGWVTLNNQSGASYEDAELKLVAGDVRRVSDLRTRGALDQLRAMESEARADMSEESFFEYHLYTLGRPTDVKNNEQKQVTLLEAPEFDVEKGLYYYGAAHYFRGQYGNVESNAKIGVYLEFENSEENGLGMPLPAGTFRVYKADRSGAQQFVGEDRIDHTPRDEEVRIRVGDAFDVVGSRTQRTFDILGSCTYESSWEITIRNHKDEPETVHVVEPAGGDWTILRSSHAVVDIDARTFGFDVEVGPRGEETVRYAIRTRWC